MQPPSRATQSTSNPGAVDLPKPRRSSSEVAAEKLKKKEAAAASAKKRREQAAEVARVEREIKAAQKEGAHSSRQVSRVKRTFSRDAPANNRVKEVSLFLGHRPMMVHPTCPGDAHRTYVGCSHLTHATETKGFCKGR